MIGATIGNTKRKRPSRKNRRKKQGKGFSGPSSPALRRSGLAMGFLLLLGGLLFGLFAGYRWAVTTDVFAVTEIEVTGNQHLSYGDVLAAGGLSLGGNSLGLNITRVQSRLTKTPWVDEVVVRRDLPGTIRVEVVEKQATWWRVYDGRLYYADGRGELITPVTPGDFTSLPVLEAPQRVRGGLERLPGLVERLALSELAFDTTRLASLKVLPTGGLECFLDQSGLTIQLDMDDFTRQLDLLERVVADLKRRGEFARVARITAGPDRVWVHKRI